MAKEKTSMNNNYHQEIGPIVLCLSPMPISLRKEKQLTFSKNVCKVQDLSNPLLATCLAKQVPGLTEQSLFQCGGELAEAGMGIAHCL